MLIPGNVLPKQLSFKPLFARPEKQRQHENCLSAAVFHYQKSFSVTFPSAHMYLTNQSLQRANAVSFRCCSHFLIIHQSSTDSMGSPIFLLCLSLDPQGLCPRLILWLVTKPTKKMKRKGITVLGAVTKDNITLADAPA